MLQVDAVSSNGGVLEQGGQESGPAGKELTNQELFTSNSHLEEEQPIASYLRPREGEL